MAIVFKTFDPVQRQLWIATIAVDGSNILRLAPGVHPHWSPVGNASPS
jgi:hypothetical protein